MGNTSGILLIALFITITSFGQDSAFDEYHIKEFEFQGHDAKIVFPKKPNQEKFWIWRARFWAAEPQTDLALLEKGFHVVYVDVAGLFGNKTAVNLWNDYYAFIRKEYALNEKVVLEGLSRGGLIIYNWASQNTEKVACIYADAPVCDIKSWPGGLYDGKGSAYDWKECLKAHDLDEKSVLDFKGIPIHTCVNVARAKIPVLHVFGNADKVVPHYENTKLLAKKFRQARGKIKLIKKKGIGHHPHSLEDPKRIVGFVLSHTTKK